MTRRQSGVPGQKPDGYVHCGQVLDGSCKIGSFVNVIGIVIDRRKPIPTRGTDWKCEMKLMDQTVEDEHQGALILNVFRPPNMEMPQAGAGDVILIRSAKVQRRYMEEPNLLTNRQTQIIVFGASQIFKSPTDLSSAVVWRSETTHSLGDRKELAYVSFVYHSTNKERVPTAAEFEVAQIKSHNVKDKFSTLNGVSDNNFYDLIVEVCRTFDAGGRITLWVTDYTENDSFWLMTEQNRTTIMDDSGCDPYGYLDKSAKKPSDATAQPSFTGPLGKRNMQVTVYDPHISIIRDSLIGPGSWVSLRNVHAKFGRNGANLEGFLREDSSAYHANQVRVSRLDVERLKEDLGPTGTRLTEALERRRAHRKANKEVDDALRSAAIAGQKRKAALGETETTKPKSKPRRKAKKAKRAKELQDAAEAAEAGEKAIQALKAATNPADAPNPYVRCEGSDRPLSRISEIIRQHHCQVDVEGEEVEVPLPFVNAQYRALVRVTNFDPPLLEDFAYLSTAGDDDDIVNAEDDASSESDCEVEFTSQASQGWKWSFSLELEDAAETTDQQQQPQRLWVVVNNLSAQHLLNLDASDLRQDDKNLDRLRDRMFILWGNLEEIKLKQDRRLRDQVEGNQPPPDSPAAEDEVVEEPVKNRCFHCCVRQYGIKVAEEDEDKRRDGVQWHWERVYGLHGTKISSRS